MVVRCNQCMKYFDEESIIHKEDSTECCPYCEQSGCITDLDTPMVEEYVDEFKNKAIIEEVFIKPFYDSKEYSKSYRLTCKSMYNVGFVYFVSVYETIEQAKNKLSSLSCNTWTKI